MKPYFMDKNIQLAARLAARVVAQLKHGGQTTPATPAR